MSQTYETVVGILRTDLKLGAGADITPETPLVGGELELDSLDVLMLVSSLEKSFGIKIDNEEIGRDAFRNVGTLCGFIEERVIGR